MGSSSSHSAGGSDLYLVRLDAAGDTLWTRTVGGADTDEGLDLVQTSDGGFIMLGFTGSFGAQTDDLLLVKVDAAGTLLWAKRLETPANEIAGDGVLHALPDGDLLVVATTVFGAGLLDLCMIRLTAEGEEVWATSYGQSGYDECRGLVPTADGGFMLMGRTTSFGSGDYNTLMVKCTETGDVSWSRIYGVAGFESASSLAAATNGYIVAGSCNTFGAGDSDNFLMKVGPSGTMSWAKTYGNAWSD